MQYILLFPYTYNFIQSGSLFLERYCYNHDGLGFYIVEYCMNFRKQQKLTRYIFKSIAAILALPQLYLERNIVHMNKQEAKRRNCSNLFHISKYNDTTTQNIDIVYRKDWSELRYCVFAGPRQVGNFPRLPISNNHLLLPHQDANHLN